MANPKIQFLVQNFVTQLEGVFREEIVRSLQTALGASVGRPALKSASSSRGSKTAKKSKATKKTATGSRARTSPAELAQNVGRIVSFVKSNPGATSEKARAALKMEKPMWLKALRHGIDSKQLSTKGEKRLTTLHLAKS